ncbi:condensin complex subunit SMC1 [Dacryopinax primogenitus]|uniref:Structural maintenance of chromosomes protein n=1 Tax=Dacryopinax primogenitus (strain DJM 731) TaxID=1858805 RepID=M5G8Y6_DACPD|nr:condensin complex subunit SMC1 [Dacryopinax primogenitus]EJU02332.1 condensin complex subunit SMC1 [Dacryopinax primogenitus]
MLQQIEVFNFKSYRRHQVIGPFKTFTCVIGPNGAGKSNLMDAISFVLGVKSSHLRSGQLKDLIYRGRKLGREDGAEEAEDVEESGDGDGDKAWVAAVYEDENGKAYRFQRNISLTGASEYRINNKVVTYHAYNSVLEQQQILVKARNFLVFQGDVEAVASQSSKDLSRLIDQISGSLELSPEYERAKAAQERATENATFNYTKRRGIATDIKQYREQKTEAEKFERLVSEKDALIVNRLLLKLYHIQGTIENNTEQIKAKNQELAAMRAEQTKLDAAHDKARKQQAEQHKATMQADKQIKKAEKSLEEKRPRVVELNAQIEHAQSKARKALALAEPTRRDIGKGEEAVEKLTTDLTAVQKAAKQAADAARAAAQKGLSFDEHSLDEYHKLKGQAATLAVAERQQRETLARDEKTHKRAMDRTQDKFDQLRSQKEKLVSDGASQAEKKDIAQKRVKEIENQLATTKRELNNAIAERDRINRLERELTEKIQDTHDRLLEAGMDQRESEREMRLKETLDELQRLFPGVRGRVINLCKPIARKYDTAVSIVLGKDIDSIVVDEEKQAIECIEYLRNQRKGQATFLPLDTLQTKTIHERYRNVSRGARLAFELIQYDSAVEKAMLHVCSNSLVCDTMKIAQDVCYNKGLDVKAVTLDGTVIHKSGLITGGSSRHSKERKWSDEDTAGLKRTLDKLVAQLRELTQSKPRQSVDEGLQTRIANLGSDLSAAKDELNAASTRLTGIQEEAKHVNKELKAVQPELEKARKTLEKVQSEVQELAVVIDAAEDEVFKAFCRKYKIKSVREYEDHQLKVHQEVEEARIRFETQISRLKHQLEFETSQLTNTKERLGRLEQMASESEAALQRLQQQKEEAVADITEDEEALAQLRKERGELAQADEQEAKKVSEAKRAAGKAAAALDKALKEISDMNTEIDKLAAERTGIYRKCRIDEINLPLKSGRLENVPIEENIRDEMALDEDEDATQQPHQVQDYDIEVDFTDLDDDDRENDTPEALSEIDASIAKITAEIEKMAPNMKAMDRLEDVETKLQDAEKEADKARKDSKTAREDFNDVKKRRCDLFNKAYNHISDVIDKVYKDLTKGRVAPEGGFAYLSLEDSEEPYLAGVKYHAMPPMKRFRDMELLSGGEKTVAALALLFAIHSYQPSPFFVLDEVDAALDNTNVAKIATYLREHAGEGFQFIVISLKNSLYERGNSLVGIYRDQEVNSSRTLTLDLTQYEG